VVGDTLCGCNLLQCFERHRDEDDIAHAQFGALGRTNPVLYHASREWSCLRFVHSLLEDVVTDLPYSPTSLSKWGEHCSSMEGNTVTRGMLVSAEWVLCDLEKHGILDKLSLLTSDDILTHRLCMWPVTR
jgi:hypothetical protein